MYTCGLREIHIMQTFFRYLGCAEYTRLGCKARAALPRSGDIRQIRINIPHNHPPDVNAAEKSAFLSKLKDAVNIIPGPLRAVYKGIAELYRVHL